MAGIRRWRSKRRSRSCCWPARRLWRRRQSAPLGPRPASEDRGREQQAPRVLANPHLAHLQCTAEISEQLFDQLADRQRGHAHGINGEDQEAAVLVEQLPAVHKQRREILLQPPDLAFRPATELGRIEQNAIVALAAPHLTRGELSCIINNPPYRTVGHAR